MLPFFANLSIKHWLRKRTKKIKKYRVSKDSISHGTLLYCNTPLGRRYLLLKYTQRPGLWDFYHGGMIYDDVHDWDSTRIRECEEFMALPPESISFVGDMEHLVSYSIMPNTDMKHIYYKIAQVDVAYFRQISPDGDEIKKLKWLSYDDAMKQLSHTTPQRFLMKVENYIKSL